MQLYNGGILYVQNDACLRHSRVIFRRGDTVHLFPARRRTYRYRGGGNHSSGTAFYAVLNIVP